MITIKILRKGATTKGTTRKQTAHIKGMKTKKTRSRLKIKAILAKKHTRALNTGRWSNNSYVRGNKIQIAGVKKCFNLGPHRTD